MEIFIYLIVGFICYQIAYALSTEISVRLNILESVVKKEIIPMENGVLGLYCEIAIQNFHTKHTLRNCKITILHRSNGIPIKESTISFPHIPPSTIISMPHLETIYKHILLNGTDNYIIEIKKIKIDHYYDAQSESTVKKLIKNKNELK